MYLSQHSYINSILHHFNFEGLKPLSTPMDTQVRLTTKQAPTSATKFAIMCNVPYYKAVGALNWATLATCPNITFAVATVACFTANPGLVHWEAVRQIFRYLADT
jgi:hypothetical protein